MFQFGKLFEPGRIGTLDLKNRIIFPPMATHMATLEGDVTDQLVDYYIERARGVALVVIEGSFPSPVGHPKRIALDHAGRLAGLQRLVRAIHQEGAKVMIEVNISGEATKLGWPSMMRAYWNNEETYKKKFKNGWYLTGDRGRVGGLTQPCLCGRSLPLIQELQGREDEVLVTADQRRVGRLDLVFKTDLPIREAQIIQERLDRIRVRVVPDPAFGPEDAACIVQRVPELSHDRGRRCG